MDEVCRAICDMLWKNGDGGYEIFFEDELTDALPEDCRNRETLERALKKLSGGGYIDVRYVRGDAFCIAPKKPYEEDLTPSPSPQISVDEQETESARKTFLYSALGAAMGGAIGGVITAIITAVILRA